MTDILDAEDEALCCFICLEPFKHGDLVLDDVSGETGHRACFGDDRESFVKDLDTGEPLGPDDPLPTGWAWEVEPSDIERQTSGDARTGQEALDDQ